MGMRRDPDLPHLVAPEVRSSLLSGYQGIDDVCLSVPSLVNRSGVDAVLEVPLSAEEAEGLRRSGDTVRRVAKSLGL